MPLSSQFELQELPKRWPLVQTPENRAADFTKDAQLINCYAEKSPKDGDYWLYKRVGFSAAIQTFTGVGRGGYYWAELLTTFWVVSGTVYAYQLGVLSSPGAIVNGTIKESFQLMDRSGTGKLVFGDGTNAYYVTSGGALTHIIDPDFPAAFVPGWAYLDGTLYVMDNKCNIVGSDIEDPSSWNALNTIQANKTPGYGVGLTRHLDYVVAFKSNSVETFYDAGNPTGSPLSRYNGGFSTYGCLSGPSIQNSDANTLWLTANNTVSPQIAMMENLRVKIVSTPAVDKMLQGVGINSGVYSFILKICGHRFYCLTMIDGGFTLVYDIDENLWYRWATGSGNYLDLTSTFEGSTVTGQGQHLVQGRLTPNIYITDSCFVYPNDFGTTIVPVDIYTPNTDFEVDRRKCLSVMRFNGDRVVGSELQIRHNDFDYDPKKWSPFRRMDLGQERPFIRDEGTFYKRAYHLRHFKNTAFRCKSLDLQLSLGTV